ncbi:hypothetical protein FHS96_003165 [Sphingomonas zeicaulis]|uniref:DUF4919 domain-containing protein n=1 Tax=Sphingomonas zeicaulis TaxID=1632740 RepID=UPI003D1FF237
MRRSLLFPMLVLAATVGHAEDARPVPSKHIAKIMERGNGLSPETAYKVSSVRDEYQIMAQLGFEVSSQSLVVQRKPYDVLEGKDADGQTRKIWFDISKFYGRF